MAVWSCVNQSEIELSRLDAEYYRPEHIQLSKKISSLESISIAKAGVQIDCSAFYPCIVPYYDFTGSGIPFLRVNEIQDGLISVNDKTAFLSENVLLANKSTIARCVPGDVVIAKGGNSVGKVALLTDDFEEYSVCRDVLVLRTQQLETLNKYLLWIYLHSKIGQSLLLRTASQTGQPHLTIEAIAKLLVPVFSDTQQQYFEDSYKAAMQAQRDSRLRYSHAQEFLEAELGLDKLTFQKPMGYVANFSDVEASRRSDAEFFHIRYEPFLSAVRSYQRGWQPLKNLTKQTLPNFDSHKRSGDVAYIEIGDVIVSSGSYAANRVAAKDLPANAKIELSGGEILISQVRPTRGAIAITDDELPHPTVCSGAFYVCTANEVSHREVIWLYLRCMKSVFEKFCGGTSYPTIDSRYIARFPVPLFDAELAKRIQQLVVQSKSALRESEQLIDQAKTRVEQLIEAAVQP